MSSMVTKSLGISNLKTLKLCSGSFMQLMNFFLFHWINTAAYFQRRSWIINKWCFWSEGNVSVRFTKMLVLVTSRCFVSGLITEYLQLPKLCFLAPHWVFQCPVLHVSIHGLRLLFSSNDRNWCRRIIQMSTSRLFFPIFLGNFPLWQTSAQWCLLHNSLLCFRNSH